MGTLPKRERREDGGGGTKHLRGEGRRKEYLGGRPRIN